MNKIAQFGLCMLCLCLSLSVKAQNFEFGHLVGLCVDSANAPLANVQIYEKNSGKIGQVKIDGYFRLELKPGNYQLVFSHPDFFNIEFPLVINAGKNDTITLQFHHKVERLDAVKINVKWKDPGPDYMKKAIARRDYWAKRIPAQRSQVYVRAFEQVSSRKKRVVTKEEIYEDKKSVNTTPPEVPIANMAEITFQRDWAPPNNIKEIRTGVSFRGDKTSLFYLSTIEGDFNIYQNLMSLPGLCPLPVMSPLSSSAMLAYRFRFVESYRHPVYGRVLKIKVDGRQTSNATFSGEIHLVDTSFYVAKIVLNIPKHLMAEYDEMTLIQNYRITKDSFILIDSQSFNYNTRAGSDMYQGTTQVHYDQIQINPNFPKGHFGLELRSAAQDAYDKDSAYWNSHRKSPLSLLERTFVHSVDSIKRVHSSDVYLDSVERVTNKITLRSLFLDGQEHKNRRKGLDFNFQPLMFIWQPWWPGGSRISLWNSINKTFENKKEIRFNENISYGLNNQDLRGTANASMLYNPYKRKLVYAAVGRDFGFVNPFAAYIDLFRRDNFYQHDHLTLYHRQEIVNGLFFRIMGEYSARKDIANYKFSKTGDSLFENNTPLSFQSHTAVFASFNLSYTPFQQYLSEPKQKVILGSTWPTFSVNYKKAIPGILGSTINYDYLEFAIDHSFPWGLLGYSELRATSGSFLSRKNINVIDYRYQRRGDNSIFTPPMYAYQLLDSTFKTFHRYYEVHYRHHFNGSLVNKIPFMKKLSLYESVGMSALYAPERRNMMYFEMYGGIDKLIRIWRERFKIGFYYCIGYNSLYNEPRTAFKINFEFYNRSANSW